MSFDNIILSDRHIVALENRAFREGALTKDDHFDSGFVTPRVAQKTPVEDSALDLMCLYDTILVSDKRFDLSSINSKFDEKIIQRRPDLVRETLGSVKGWGSERRIWNEKPPIGLSDSEYEKLISNASWEAQKIITIDFLNTLEDAKAVYDSDFHAFRGDVFALSDSDITHQATVKYLKINAFWIADAFYHWFKYGSYNQLIDDFILRDMGLPKELRRWFNYFSKSERFCYYFRYLQESYANTYDSAFIRIMYGIDQAHVREPSAIAEGDTHCTVSDISSVIRVNLSDIVEYFPLPRTIEEAIEDKHKKEIQVFRRVMSDWIGAVSKGEGLEQKIRSDLQKANRDIKRLKSYRELKERPIIFGIRVAASQIPVVGNLISVFDVLEFLWERRVKRRTSWVVTPASGV